jgi:hypothetical protein
MQISGEWYECEDGIVRPTVVANLRLTTGVLRGVRFVLDTAADRTALAASLVPLLPPLAPPPDGLTLTGVGGTGLVWDGPDRAGVPSRKRSTRAGAR